MPQIVEIPGQGEVEFPDGMTDAQIVAAIKRLSTAKPAPQESLARKVAGGALEPMVTMASGALATPAAGIAGLATGAAQALGVDKVPLIGSLVPKENPADVVRGVQSRFTYQPQTQGGKDALSVIGAPFEALERVTDEAGGRVADMTGSPGYGATTKAALSIIPAMLLSKGAKPTSMPTPLPLMRKGAESLMRTSLKPAAIADKTGKAGPAVQTMLDEGITVSEGGVNKLTGKIDTLNDAITDAIANSRARVSRQAVERPVYDVEQRFGRQATPQSDLAAIEKVLEDFRTHPLLPRRDIPVQVAQEMKQGTYRALKDKYGEVGSASTEAQKALARGLKEEVAAAVPEVAPLNAKESALLNAKNLLEHRVAIERNANPTGLGPLAASGLRTLAFMADRSGILKSLAARAMNPGKGMGITDEMVLAGSGPGTFSQEDATRKALIDALLGRTQ